MTGVVVCKNRFKWQQFQLSIILVPVAITIIVHCFNPNNKPNVFLSTFNKRGGYDAKTGRWIDQKPSYYAFPITKVMYQNVKNWYATDSGTNNPGHLPILSPRPGYTYIYTPYKDPAHPGVTGMSMQGEDGYKGYWYADKIENAK
jgi:hypothetical protein